MQIVSKNKQSLVTKKKIFTFVQTGARISDTSGGGDMTKAVYDPTAVNDDAFDMENMSEGASNKILSTNNKSALDGGNSPSATNVVETRNESESDEDVTAGGTVTLDVTADNVFVITTDDTAFTIATTGEINSRGITLVLKFTAALPTITWPTLANTAPDISGATATTGKAIIEMLYIDGEWWAWLVEAI